MSAAPSIDSIIAGVLEREGEAFTDRPDDKGGPTKWGITLATLSAFLNRPASLTELQALTREQATAIYEHRYVELPGFGMLLGVSAPIAAKLIDTGVNCGTAVATVFLQRALNAFNERGTRYPDMQVDGKCGTGTVAALRAFLAWRGAEGERVLLEAVNCLQGAHYIMLAETTAQDEAFVYGWLRARVAA